MKFDLKTTRELAESLKLTTRGVRKRAERRGVRPTIKGRTALWTPRDVAALAAKRS